MIQNRIYIGPIDNPYLILDNDSIISSHVNRSTDPIGAELAIDTLECVFRFSGFALGFAPSDYPDGMETADGQIVYCKATRYDLARDILLHYEVHVFCGEEKLGLFYVGKLVQTGAEEYTMSAYNWIGVLDEFHALTFEASGKCNTDVMLAIYNCVEAADSNIPVLQSIINRLKISPAANDVTAPNALIVCDSIRRMVQNILFAYGLTAIDDGTDILIDYTTNAPQKKLIDDLIYSRGNVCFATQPSRVTVSEYSYARSAEWEDLFDNLIRGTATEKHSIVIEGMPAWTWVMTDDSTGTYEVTFAKIGDQSCCVKIDTVGPVHIMIKRLLPIKIERSLDNPNGGDGTSISVDSYAVNALNSRVALRRLAAFYFSKRSEISLNYVWNGELCGRSYTAMDAFKRVSDGVISSCKVDMSAIQKASATMVADWEPYTDAPFSHSVVLTGRGIWTLPKGVTAIRVTLVGGGSGGSSGLKGSAGKSVATNNGILVPAAGGAAGQAGDGGNIYSEIIEFPDQVYAYVCGSGGAGGGKCASTKTRNPGNPGTDTIFGSLSSAFGNRIATGVYDEVTKLLYGAKLSRETKVRDTATAGGDAWNGYYDEPTEFGYWTYENGIYQDLYFENRMGKPSRYVKLAGSQQNTLVIAGAPGGSTVRAKSASTVANSWIVKNESMKLSNGTSGASPTVPGLYPLDIGKPLYGWGGGGGHGGGGGGHAGYAVTYGGGWDKYLKKGNPGEGGSGGAGGRGAPGCVIINY